ncbi:DUF29 domain-containing protein [Caulobacter sp. S45]|uniref:DUF29 domain-containing protein n=1 Tax=Caulobacter sp. S45 TaxID=1641861 RepID=UPI0015754879|nr:DUF29 domain-containing protein [Caulobacter sp. S45]
MGRLYSTDFYGWTQDQADALRRRSVNEIDWDNLLAEIEDLGGSTRRELRSRLALIIQHLLKWRHQTSRRSTSWAVTIIEQRAQVSDLLEENPSLLSKLDEIMVKAARAGISGAVADTGMAPSVFHAGDPLTFDKVMTTSLDVETDEA